MIKRAIAIFFTTLFLALITAPSVIIVLDDSIDTSVFYSMTEEEENGKSKSLDSPFSLQTHDALTNFSISDLQFFSYRFKTYSKPHLNLVFPPPEKSIS
ncbi:hypothetical protein [Aestuariibaculum sediminum]|uniref:Uncharacterized protein n=1 Tax=Aestuariibaculum sediminum TaxID=2770637 RepID=A0A8J6Q1Z9_9FLAO|nr:hypothetical protein [Aestuariibaculum sediminum]MBD0831460.1 hypothetical protein [Aestuariibaculum sediminum]